MSNEQDVVVGEPEDGAEDGVTDLDFDALEAAAADLSLEDMEADSLQRSLEDGFNDFPGETKMLSIDQIDPDPENPFEMTPEEFSLLCDSIEEDGFIDPIEVWQKEDGRYQLIGGDKRVRALKVLGAKQVKATILDHERYDKDRRRALAMRLNILRGDIRDMTKFKSVVEDMRQRYTDQAIRTMFGFSKEEIWAKLVRQIEDQLPTDTLKDKYREKTQDLAAIDDLSAILRDLFAEYGETLEYDFMAFTFGGRTHLMVRMDTRLRALMDRMGDLAMGTQSSIAVLLCNALEAGWPTEDTAPVQGEAPTVDEDCGFGI